MFSALIEKPGRRRDLTVDEAEAAIAVIMRGDADRLSQMAAVS